MFLSSYIPFPSTAYEIINVFNCRQHAFCLQYQFLQKCSVNFENVTLKNVVMIIYIENNPNPEQVYWLEELRQRK